MCCVDAVRGSGKRGCLDSPHTTKLGCRTDSPSVQRTKYLKIYDTIFCLSNTVFVVRCTFGSFPVKSKTAYYTAGCLLPKVRLQ